MTGDHAPATHRRDGRHVRPDPPRPPGRGERGARSRSSSTRSSSCPPGSRARSPRHAARAPLPHDGDRHGVESEVHGEPGRHRSRQARPTRSTPCATSVRERPDSDLFFISGADAIAQILVVEGLDELWDLAHFVAVSRPGHALSVSGLPEHVVSLLEVPALAISSTDCRIACTGVSRCGTWCLMGSSSTSPSTTSIGVSNDVVAGTAADARERPANASACASSRLLRRPRNPRPPQRRRFRRRPRPHRIRQPARTPVPSVAGNRVRHRTGSGPRTGAVGPRTRPTTGAGPPPEPVAVRHAAHAECVPGRHAVRPASFRGAGARCAGPDTARGRAERLGARAHAHAAASSARCSSPQRRRVRRARIRRRADARAPQRGIRQRTAAQRPWRSPSSTRRRCRRPFVPPRRTRRSTPVSTTS